MFPCLGVEEDGRCTVIDEYFRIADAGSCELVTGKACIERVSEAYEDDIAGGYAPVARALGHIARGDIAVIEAAPACDIGLAANLHLHIDILAVDEGEHIEPCAACIEIGLDGVLIVEIFDMLHVLSQYSFDEVFAEILVLGENRIEHEMVGELDPTVLLVHGAPLVERLSIEQVYDWRWT